MREGKRGEGEGEGAVFFFGSMELVRGVGDGFFVCGRARGGVGRGMGMLDRERGRDGRSGRGMVYCEQGGAVEMESEFQDGSLKQGGVRSKAKLSIANFGSSFPSFFPFVSPPSIPFCRVQKQREEKRPDSPPS